MNIRQKAKKLKIENGLMRDIIHDTDRLEQIYIDAISKPLKSLSIDYMEWERIVARTIIPRDMILDAKQKILMSKRELEQMIFNRIKDHIGYKMNDNQDVIEAVIFVGKKKQ